MSVWEGEAKSKHYGRHVEQAKTNGRKHVWPSGGPGGRVHLNRTDEWRLVSSEPGPDQTYRRILPQTLKRLNSFTLSLQCLTRWLSHSADESFLVLLGTKLKALCMVSSTTELKLK